MKQITVLKKGAEDMNNKLLEKEQRITELNAKINLKDQELKNALKNNKVRLIYLLDKNTFIGRRIKGTLIAIS